MAFGFKNFLKGLRLVPVSTTAVSVKGDLEVLDASGKLNYFNGTSASPLVSEAHSATLTNKVLNADLNTISNIDDNEIKAAANIQISKLLAASINHVIISSGTGVLTSEATLAKSRGGSGQDNSSITFPASGVLVTEAGTQTLTNKTIDADLNTLSNIENADIKSGANIDRTKLASGTNYRLVANNASGVMAENAALTAAHVIFADANGQLSGEATLAKSRGGSGQDNSSITFPASGTLVTTTGTQTLSNKSFSDPVTLAEISTPSTPSSGNGKIYFKSDGFLYQLNDDGTETKVGAGSGGINYITNGDAESNTSGWAAYANAAGSSPVDGTGGSPNVTITRSTSSPLRGTGSFLLSKDAANRQGQGVSYDFTIADADKAKPLSISFNYSIASGTFVSGDSSDLRVYLYDVTNGQVIQPAPYTIQGGAGSNHRFLGTFQTASNSNSYRLILHIADALSNAWTFKFDDVSVGPQTLNYGSPVTDWKSEIATGSLSTNTTYAVKSKRMGDEAEFLYTLSFSGSPGTYSLITLNLPAGYTIDTAKLNSSTQALPLGHGMATRGSNNWYLDALYSSSAVVQLVNYRSSGGYIDNSAFTNTIPTSNFTSGDTIQVYFKVPIVGWSSTVEMSNDTDTRVCAARANTSTTTINNTTPVVIFTATDYDTHGAYNSSNGRFTAPVSGKYQVSTSLRFNSQSYGSGNVIELYVYKNGSQYSILDRITSTTITATYMIDGSDTIVLNAGDYIDIRAYNDVSTAVTSATGNHFAVERVSGPSAIAASESVNARYSTNASQSIPSSGTPSIIDFEDKEFDSHGAITTGASWKFTAPANGKYRVSAIIDFASGAAVGERGLYIYKNGSLHSLLDNEVPVVSFDITCSGTALVSLNAGDYIDLRAAQSSGSAISIGSQSYANYVCIEKVGN